MPRKLALMTGISNYPTAPLPGPIDDVIDWSQFLFGSRGFGKADVIPVTNQRATTKNILTYLEQIVDILQPEDTGFWLFTGHAAQFPTHTPTLEPDGLDEVLCPFDFDWTPERMITDKQIGKVLRRLKPGVSFTVVCDACHSGDITRDMPQALSEVPHPMYVKSHPVPRDIRWMQEAALETAAIQQEIIQEIPLNISYISGCRSDQKSTDAFFDNRYNGALTYFTLKVLKCSPPTITTRELVVKVGELLRQHGFKQEPQAEGVQIGNPFLLPFMQIASPVIPIIKTIIATA